MRSTLSRRGTVVLAFVVAQVVGTSIYALAGQGPGSVHEATTPVTGLEVTDVTYELGAEDRFDVERVTFRVDGLPDGSTIEIRLSPEGDWFTCDTTGEPSCETPGTTAQSVTELSVVIAG